MSQTKLHWTLLLWVSALWTACSAEVDYAEQQPHQGNVRYWLAPSLWARWSSETYAAEGLIGTMGWQFTRTWNREDASVTIEPGGPELCDGSRVARTSERAGAIMLCVGEAQLDDRAISHEMAHALGVSHTEGWGIMSAVKSSARAFTWDDVEMFQRRTLAFSIFSER
jgi:hypothetical protein